MPLISVVIPTYNMATYLDEAILSVTTGSFDEVEVLVVDDGSTDDTRAVVEPFTTPGGAHYDSRVKYTHKSNGGKPSAVNAAFHQAKGEYLAILDADDRLTPDSLSTRYAATRAGAGEKVEVVIGGIEVFGEGEIAGRREAPGTVDSRALQKRFYLSYKTPFHLNTCLFSKETAFRTGLFDTRLKRCEDIDYALRLLKQVDEVAVVDRPVYRYRKHRQSALDRLHFRGQTILYRPFALWKNTSGLLRLWAVFHGAAMDIAKAVYEIYGNYKN